MAKPKYKLRVKSLQFISAVTKPAQEFARAAIIKHADDGDEIAASFKVAKIADEIGVVIGWAVTSTIDGEDHYDLQGDHVTEDELLKAAVAYSENGAPVDEMHDEQTGAGRAVFLFPLTADIAAALGITTSTTGLLAGLKVAPDVLAKFKDGTYSGFSIGGFGDREQVGKSTQTPKLTTPPVPSATAMLTTNNDGHSHLVENVGTLTSGRTTASYATTVDQVVRADTEHTHAWTRNSDGTVTIAPALNHAHELMNIAAPPPGAPMSKGSGYADDDPEFLRCLSSVQQPSFTVVPAPVSKHVSRALDRMTEGAPAFAQDVAEFNHAWLDAMPYEQAVAIAKEHSANGAESATTWLATRTSPSGGPVAKIDGAAIMKAARDRVAKGEVDLRSAVHRYQKANQISTYAEAMAFATLTDPATRAAYDELEDARDAVKKGPSKIATAQHDAEIARLRGSIAKSVEQFSITHDRTPSEAHDRLEAISPTFKAQVAELHELLHARDVVVERERIRAEQ